LKIFFDNNTIISLFFNKLLEKSLKICHFDFQYQFEWD
jgi:hypothetical protein